jgi:hypothetical protein
MTKKPVKTEGIVTKVDFDREIYESTQSPRIKLKDLKKKNTALGKKKPPSEKE